MAASTARSRAATNLLPALDVADDPVVCRLRTLVIVATALTVLGTLAMMIFTGRPLPGWKIALLAVLILPVLRTTIVPVLCALADLLLLYLLARPGLGGWTSVTVFALHLAAVVWFLGSTVRPTAWLHRSAVRLVALRFVWVQAVAQIAVLVAIATADLPGDALIGTVGVLVLLGLGTAVAVLASRYPALPQRWDR